MRVKTNQLLTMKIYKTGLILTILSWLASLNPFWIMYTGPAFIYKFHTMSVNSWDSLRAQKTGALTDRLFDSLLYECRQKR